MAKLLLFLATLVLLWTLGLTGAWQAEDLEKQNSRLLNELERQQRLVEVYQSEVSRAIGNAQYSINRNSENIDALHSRVREVELVVR